MALGAVAGDPAVGALAGDAERFRDVSDGPVIHSYPLDAEKFAVNGQTRVNVTNEDLRGL